MKMNKSVQKYLVLLTLILDAECQILQQLVLEGLQRAINFVYYDCKNLNVDGVFGVVLAEAHLQMILKESENATIAEMRTKTAEIRNMSQNFLFEKPHKYWVFKHVVAIPSIWTKQICFGCKKLNRNYEPQFQIPFNITTKEGFLDYINNSTFDEEESDECIVEIASTGSSETHHECPISRKCRKFVFENLDFYDPNFQAYGVTHRLLQLQVARARNCRFSEKLLSNKILEFCSYILWEAETIRNFNFPPDLTDLLFEQLVLCGYEGFEEFFDSNYIIFALRAQRPSGCYSDASFTKSREKRETIRMKDGCSSHTTGLGIALMASFLRYFAHLEAKKPQSNYS